MVDNLFLHYSITHQFKSDQSFTCKLIVHLLMSRISYDFPKFFVSSLYIFQLKRHFIDKIKTAVKKNVKTTIADEDVQWSQSHTLVSSSSTMRSSDFCSCDPRFLIRSFSPCHNKTTLLQ